MRQTCQKNIQAVGELFISLNKLCKYLIQAFKLHD
jgi:hypothetical protein